MTVENTSHTLQVNNYQVEKKFSPRHSSSLYLAHDTSLNRSVFLEVFPAAESPDAVIQLHQRLETVTSIKHESIIPISETGLTEQNQPYVVSEYTSGTTVADILADQTGTAVRLPVPTALMILRQIADALNVAHAVNIVHNDLRPHNIIIRDDGKPKLIGLGVPDMSSTSAGKAEDREAADVLAYASPEQVAGFPTTVQSNIYSLGVILYELLAGHRPQIRMLPAYQAAERRYSVVPLEEVRPGLTAETYRLLRNCLQYSPQNRFSTLVEMIAAIDVAVSAEEAVQQQILAPTKRSLVPYIAGGVLLVGIIIAGLLFLSRQNEISPQIQTTPLEVNTVLTLQAKGTIEILGPEPGAGFNANDTVTFDWFWPSPLESDQQFVIHLLADDTAFLLGSVTRPFVGARYQLELKGNEIASVPGEYSWQIVLERISTGESLFVSDTRLIQILAPTPIPTSKPTITNSAIITNTVTITPTSTSTFTATPTITLTPSSTPDCVRTQPFGWAPYSIKLGDALSPLSVQTGASVERIMTVNCLDSVSLSVGQVIWLPGGGPSEPPTPTSGPEPSPPPGATQPPPPPPPPQPTQPPPTPTPPPP